MNIKRQAARLESYLEEEIKQELPIAILKDGSIGYKSFKIKQNQQGEWTLRRYGGFVIDKFNLKACALIGARYYSADALSSYNEIKMLDGLYQRNASDSAMFKQRYTTTKDLDRKDLYLWRWEVTEQRAKAAKQQIVSKFNVVF